MGWKAVVPFKLNGALCSLHKTALSLQSDAASQRHCMGCVSEMLFCSSQNLNSLWTFILLEFFMILTWLGFAESAKTSGSLAVHLVLSAREKGSVILLGAGTGKQHRFLVGVESLHSATLKWGEDTTFPSALWMDLYGFYCFGLGFVIF